MNLAVRKIATKPEFTIPELCEASPAYASLVTRKEGLVADKTATEREIARVAGMLRTLPNVMHQEKVAALVGDHVPQGESRRPSKEQLLELKQHLHAVDQAIAVIDSRINTERSKASMLICDIVQDEHRLRARAVCLKLIDLREAMLSYSQLAEELNDKDISWARLHPSQLLALGHPLDPQSRTAIYLREMVKTGFLEQNEVPEKIR